MVMVYKRGGFRWREGNFIIGTEIHKIRLGSCNKAFFIQVKVPVVVISSHQRIRTHQESSRSNTSDIDYFLMNLLFCVKSKIIKPNLVCMQG